MTLTSQELERRRLVWEVLSRFFLDTELDDEQRRQMAQVIVTSGFSPAEIHAILWDEVYPVVESNLRSAIGEWAGFDLDWMQQAILSGNYRRTLPMRITGALPYSPARMVRKEWEELLPFLPECFRRIRLRNCVCAGKAQ
jgi:hypothetical protein